MKKKIKILLIDNDPFIRMLVKDIFWVYGRDRYQILAAESLEKGEEILKKEKPDLIFLDLVFPKDGLETRSSLNFLQEVKSNPKTEDIKVIVFSGYLDLKEICLNLGAEKFLTKGEYLPKELFELTEKMLRERK